MSSLLPFLYRLQVKDFVLPQAPMVLYLTTEQNAMGPLGQELKPPKLCANITLFYLLVNHLMCLLHSQEWHIFINTLQARTLLEWKKRQSKSNLTNIIEELRWDWKPGLGWYQVSTIILDTTSRSKKKPPWALSWVTGPAMHNSVKREHTCWSLSICGISLESISKSLKVSINFYFF